MNPLAGLLPELAAQAPATTRVAAVVLAAGSSRRMGGPHKLLLDAGGEPIVRRTVGNVLAFGPVETVVVTGHGADEVEAALAGLPVTFVRNPDHTKGQPTSVAAGVRALRAPADAVMVVLADQPQLRLDDFRALVAAFERLDRGSILVPHHRGQRGNPVVFATRHVPDVVRGTVNVGCRHLIEDHPDAVAKVEMASEAFVLDCDTPEDYRALVARLGNRPSDPQVEV